MFHEEAFYLSPVLLETLLLLNAPSTVPDWFLYADDFVVAGKTKMYSHILWDTAVV